MDKSDLPPSLAVVPNIPWAEQTLEQLEAERDYWQKEFEEITSWGAACKFAYDCINICDEWIKRRQKEAGK